MTTGELKKFADKLAEEYPNQELQLVLRSEEDTQELLNNFWVIKKINVVGIERVPQDHNNKVSLVFKTVDKFGFEIPV